MQQINLYQPLFRKQEKIFSARTMLEGAVIVLAGILLFYVYALWQTASLERQVTAAQQRQTQAAEQARQLAAEYPERRKDPVLTKQVQHLQNEVQVRQLVMARLSDRSEGNRVGYTQQLEGLARQRVAGLWLTHVGIRQGGSSLVLAGTTLQADLVPQLLQRLSQEPVFAGMEFKFFTMNRPKDKANQIDFALMTDKTADKAANK